MLCRFFCLVILALSEVGSQKTVTQSHLDIRNDERLPVKGTKNWQLLLPQQSEQKFSPRHSHATSVFKCPFDQAKQCLWLTGGYSDSHLSFDLRYENENCDVWYSRDGAVWTQVALHGHYIQGVGNWDAKPGGFAAPWYARYGHSLNAVDANGDGIADVMVLAGGNSPMPSNDVWLSKDGSHWYFDGNADWPKRAYHSTAVFKGKLFIIAGTPLSNDVWTGSLVKDMTREVGYKMKWTQMEDAPWMPRVGSCAVVHTFNDTKASSLSNITVSNLFILGGLAGRAQDTDYDYEGIRTRNDIWKTTDGETWQRVSPPTNDSILWAGRAFHGCATLKSVINDPTTQPKIYIVGGGYMGTDGNREVRSLESYTDTWWSYDGSKWTKINYEEGSKHQDNLYSTNEWTEIALEGGRTVYRGKWGFSLEAFHNSQDLDGDGTIKKDPTPMTVCSAVNETLCKTILLPEDEIPTLFLIGGKVEGFSMVSDTFASKKGIHCEVDGITCGNNGTCGDAGVGCIW